MAQNIFNDSKYVVTIIAGLKILLEYSGKQQKEEAAAFILKDRPKYPKALLEALRKVGGKGGGGGGGSSSSSSKALPASS